MPEGSTTDNTFKLIVENAYNDASANGDPSSVGKKGTNATADRAADKTPEQTGKNKAFMGKLNDNMGKFLKKELDENAKQKEGGNIIKGALKQTGIQLTLGNLLKQSQVFTGVLNAVFSVIGAMFDIILAPFMPLIAKFLEDTIPVLIGFAQNIADFLSGEISDLMEMGIVDYFKDRIQKVWEWMSEELPGLLVKAWDWFSGFVTEKIPEWLGFASDGLNDSWTWITENIPAFLEKAWAWIEEYWPTILQGLIDFVSTLWDAVKGWLANLIASLPGFLASMLYMLADFYEKFGPMIAQGLGWLVNTIITNIPKLVEALINGVAWVITDVIGRGLAGLARFLGEKVSEAILGVVRWVTGFLKDIKFEVWGQEFRPFHGLARGVEGGAEFLVGEDGLLNMQVDAIAGLWTGLTEGVGGLLHMGADIWGSDMVGGMFDWAGNVSGNLVESALGGLYTNVAAEGLRSLAAGLETEGTKETFEGFGENIANLNIDVTVNGSKQQEQSAQLDKHNKKIQVEVANDIGMRMLSASDQPVHYNQSVGLFNNWG